MGIAVGGEGSATVTPGGDAVSEETLNFTSTEVSENLGVNVEPPQPAEL